MATTPFSSTCIHFSKLLHFFDLDATWTTGLDQSGPVFSTFDLYIDIDIIR